MKSDSRPSAMRIRRTKVTVVTEHVFTFFEHRSPIQVACSKCGGPAKMIRLDEAAAASGFSLDAIREQVEANGLHLTEEKDGAVFICVRSLLNNQ
jgi:hypothetical protein